MDEDSGMAGHVSRGRVQRGVLGVAKLSREVASASTICRDKKRIIAQLVLRAGGGAVLCCAGRQGESFTTSVRQEAKARSKAYWASTSPMVPGVLVQQPG